MTNEPDAPLPVLLLTSSPLLREEVGRMLASPPEGGAVRLHLCEPRERDYPRAMEDHRPRVVLVAVDDTPERDLRQCREVRLAAQVVAEWRVPTLVLGLRPGDDAAMEKAAARASRAAGAIGFLPHDRWAGDDGAYLRARLGAAARVKVVRPLGNGTGEFPVIRMATGRAVLPARKERRAIVIIGSSAGGPDALRELLRALPPHLPVPLLLVQHIPPSFGPALAADLSRLTSYRVSMAAVGDDLLPGRVYLAPGRQALTIAGGRVIAMSEAESGGAHGQAIDRTMESAAACYGADTVGVILSGMGEDGVRGLGAIKARGGATFGQDEASCHVYGMPRRAAELNLLDHSAAPAEIGAAIGRLFGLSALRGGAGAERLPVGAAPPS